jgi:8-oxo-dGTP diphosphatase
MESEHFRGKIAQKAVIEKDGKVLICRHPQNGTLWELPGGRLHAGESLKAGLTREIMEELNVESEIGEMFYSEQGAQVSNGEPHVYLMYRVSLVSPEKELKLDPEEIQEIKWIGKEGLKDQELYPNCLRALEAYFGVR